MQEPATSTSIAGPVLELRGISKSFGNVHALKNVSIDFAPGEVHAIVGENGAGKSTLIAVPAGVLIADGGDNAWDSSGFRNFNCRACERSISPYDYRHRLVLTSTYELPFGKGKQFGANWNRFVNAILGQWQVNGLMTLSSGQPMQMTTTGNTSFSFGGGQRPDSTGQNAKLDNPTLERWFHEAGCRRWHTARRDTTTDAWLDLP